MVVAFGVIAAFGVGMISLNFATSWLNLLSQPVYIGSIRITTGILAILALGLYILYRRGTE